MATRLLNFGPSILQCNNLQGFDTSLFFREIIFHLTFEVLSRLEWLLSGVLICIKMLSLGTLLGGIW